jgi:hypothetical protein
LLTPTGLETACGNGLIEGVETCDDGTPLIEGALGLSTFPQLSLGAFGPYYGGKSQDSEPEDEFSMHHLMSHTLTLTLCLSVIGCGKKPIEDVCEDSCKKNEECGTLDGSIAECTDDCVDGLKEASEDCEDAVRDAGRCMNSASCEKLETGEACLSEVFSLLSECEDLVEFGGEECCSEDDACGWANDAVCDCYGEFDWDAADCS